MVFGIGRKDAQDSQDAEVPAKVPYRLASYNHDHEGKRFRSSSVVYSFWSASKYVLILSLILWWLPMFGQMIAGYVGGRRAGGPWRGVAASILPVVCLYIVIKGFDSGLFPSHLFGVAIAPAAVGAALAEGVPFIAPYIQFSSQYIGSFVAALAGASPYGINMYVLTVAFAYVGGILAEQNRREIEFNSGATTATTTVLVQDSKAQHELPPAPQPYPSSYGLAHMLSSVFPWSRPQDPNGAQPHPHAATAHGHGSWSKAVPMMYREGPRRAEVAMLPPADFEEVPAKGPSKRKLPRKAHKAPLRDGDPWLRPDRRTKKHFSSAKRFARSSGPELRRMRKVNPAGDAVPRIIPGDRRSVKRAKRVIDADWGHRRYQVLEDRPSRRAHRPTMADEVPAAHPAHRAPKQQMNQWDSI